MELDDYTANLVRIGAWQRSIRSGDDPTARLFSEDRREPPTIPPALSVAHQQRGTVAERARAGEVERVRRGIYLPLADDPEIAGLGRDEAILRAARGVVDSVSQDAVLSHTTAGLLHGGWLHGVPAVVHVTYAVNPHITTAGDPSVRRHWTTLTARDRAVVGGVAVTSMARTVVDCARTMPFPGAVVLTDSLFRRGAAPAVVATIVEESRGGRGIVQAREVLRCADPGAGSPGETLMRLGARGVRPRELRTQVPVSTANGTYWIDVGWPDLKVGLEFDGAIKYSGGGFGDPDARRRADAERLRALEAAGWVIVRLTWDDVADVDRLDQEIRRALRMRASAR